ncbi:MAG TPA: hypothetical protein VJ063_20475 [Verrucomicrobiae bacterium]|nr:hypothetical protein [Verrucomicrobiae bacterium]
MSKSFILLILVAGLFVACKKSQDTTSSGTSNPPPASASGNPVTAPADYLGAIAKGKKTADAKIETASINKAAQMFYVQEGRYPKDLNELVRPDYLPQLPTPPPGMKFDYNPKTGEVKVVPQ